MSGFKSSQFIQVFLGLQNPFLVKKPVPAVIIFCIHVYHGQNIKDGREPEPTLFYFFCSFFEIV